MDLLKQYQIEVIEKAISRNMKGGFEIKMSNLIEACKNGDLAEEDIFRAIQMASEFGHLQLVKYLVSQGADVRAGDDWIVRLASRNGHLEVVKYLVSQGANVRANDDLAVRWASEGGHLEIVKYLVSQGADIRANDDYAIQWASWNDHFEVVKYLVSQGAPTTHISKNTQKYISFCEKIQKKRKIRAQKKIYFWWIQICYDLSHPSGCGLRMAKKNVSENDGIIN